MTQAKIDVSTAVEKIISGEELSDVLGVSATQIQAQAALAYNLYQQGKLQEAETIFRGLTGVNTKSPYGYAGLGAVAMAKRPSDLTTAYENISKAAALAPNDPTVQANLGEVLLRQGKFEEAGQQFKKALELDPNSRDPGANRARAILAGLNAVASEVQRISKQAAAA